MNICNYCEHENTCKNKPPTTTRCRDYKEKRKNKVSEELKCPNCQQKDKEIVDLKEDLSLCHHVLSSIFTMAKSNNGVLYFSKNENKWEIETKNCNIGSITVELENKI